MCLPRFNRNTFLFQRELNDAAHYIAYTEYFRGADLSASLEPAFNWRPLVPFLAAPLPFDAMTAINIVNVLGLILGLFFLRKSLVALSFSSADVQLGSHWYSLSFPVFYYATVGYIDSFLVGLIGVGIYLLLTQKWALFSALLVVATFCKEGAFVLIPTATLLFYEQNKRSFPRTIFWAAFWSVLYLGVSALIRWKAPLTVPQDQVIWAVPANFFYENTLTNIFTFRKWIAGLLTLGLPLWVMFRFRTSINKAFLNVTFWHTPFAVHTLIAIVLYLVAFVVAVPDGRTIWLAYPAFIPLVLALRNQAMFTNAVLPNDD